jgi:hypothetical protein
MVRLERREAAAHYLDADGKEQSSVQALALGNSRISPEQSR